MSHRCWLVAALSVAAGCASPEAPSPPLTDQPSPSPFTAQQAEDRGRRDRLARRFAKALRDSDFRGRVYREIKASTHREGKVHLQGFMDRNGGAERQNFFELAGDPATDVAADLDQSGALEVYLPVPAHRKAWTGDSHVLVATAETDTEAPVGYDLQGQRLLLDRRIPPSTPVIAVNRAELDFAAPPNPLTCILDCGGPGGSGTGPQGVYLTQTSFNGTFEGWLKGDPEFEIHVLGPATSGSTAMTTYQCIGANVGGPYTWDQNAKTWTGNVLLFSQTQIDQFKQQNPGQGFRIVVVEDDDTACQIKIDSTRVTNMLNAIKVIYGDLTAARDSTSSTGKKLLERGLAFSRFVKAVASFFLTNDDPVGNAVKDSLVASSYFPTANWAVRGENTTVNGALRLEIR